MDITIDNAGNLYCVGNFKGIVDFNPGNANFSLASIGENDIFVLKLDASGNFVWAKKMGGIQDDFPSSVVVDGAGNVYTTGYFSMTADFDPNAGIFNLVSAYYWEVYISKLDANGDFVWAKKLDGGINSDAGYSIDLDGAGNVYVTGEFMDTGDFDPGVGVFNMTSAGGWDTFILKLDNAGNFVWAKQIGGLGYDMGFAIAVDFTGNIYVNGFFYGSVDFDPNAGSYTLNAGSYNSVFVLKLDINGDFVWVKPLGYFNFYYMSSSLELDNKGNPYTIGSFYGTIDFDPSANSYTLSSLGDYDIFIWKLDTLGNFVWAKQIGGLGTDLGGAIAFDPLGNVYTTGYFKNTPDFDTELGVYNLSSVGLEDIFIHKINQCTTSDTLTEIACDTYSLNGQVYTTSGTYTQSYANLLGCDSMIVLNLTINPTSSMLITQSTCDPYSLNGQTYTTTGIYTQNLTNISGCDSILTLDLTINTTNELLSVIACKFYIFDSQVYINSGIYPHIYTNILGCDSIVTLDLTIIQALDISVTQNTNSLSSNAVNANYQWIDCSNNMPIPGATSQTFTPTVNGNYAVIVSETNCSDTSDCFLVTGIGVVKENIIKDIRVYPNPCEGLLTIDLGDEYRGLEVKAYNLLGQLVSTAKYEHE